MSKKFVGCLGLFLAAACSSTKEKEKTTPVVSTTSAVAPAPTTYKMELKEVLEPYPGMKIHHYVMGNGMNIYLVPRVQNGTIAVTTGYRVGSRFEELGKTGLAHLFEHMMFRGTESFPNPFRTLQEWGGESNAFTSTDQTVYYEMVPASKLDDVIRFEAERMRKLLITPEVFNTERGAVVSERKMNFEDSPGGRVQFELNQLAYDKHPYKTLPIGWQEDIDKASFEDALSFYNHYYTPNRASMAMVGDFDLDKAVASFEKYYGKYKPSDVKDPVNEKENPYRKNRQKTVHIKAHNVIIARAVIGPQYDSPDAAAEFFFCVLMADPNLGYLRHTLVESNIARAASGSCYPDVEPGLSIIRIIGAPGVKSAVLEKKFKEAWKGFLAWAKGDRFENNKKLFETSQLESLRNPLEFAQTIATNATTMGDPLYTFKLVDKIKALKFEEIEARYKDWNKRGEVKIILEPAEKNDPMKKG